MQSYNNITDCIKMCERMLRNNSMGYSKFEFKSKFDQSEFAKVHEKKDFLGGHPLPLRSGGTSGPRCPETPFHPSRTIAVQNFQPEAETHVQSLVAMFGIVESCVVLKDDAPSCLAVVQYRSKTSAADALLAMPSCQVRGSNLVVHLLWNGPYESAAVADTVHHSFRECAERRVVCVGHLPRNVNPEVVCRRCSRYGAVEDVKIQSHDQGAFAYVVFRTALAAAVATYCLRNSSTSSAALMLGYSENGSPVLLGPVRVRPLDQYPVPLSAFDVRCVCTRFLDYSRFKGLFVGPQRRPPTGCPTLRPGEMPESCIRIPTSQVKGVSLFIEISLCPSKFASALDGPESGLSAANSRNHLFRFSVDFGLHKPIMSHDERQPRHQQHAQHHQLRWHSFFILDLQVCYPWDCGDPSELRLVPRLQGMNHVYSEIEPGAFDEGGDASCWFGGALRHTTCNLSSKEGAQHREKIGFILGEDLPFVRLVGKAEELNEYQIPVHVYSDVQSGGVKH